MILSSTTEFLREKSDEKEGNLLLFQNRANELYDFLFYEIPISAEDLDQFQYVSDMRAREASVMLTMPCFEYIP